MRWGKREEDGGRRRKNRTERAERESGGGEDDRTSVAVFIAAPQCSSLLRSARRCSAVLIAAPQFPICSAVVVEACGRDSARLRAHGQRLRRRSQEECLRCVGGEFGGRNARG